MVELPAVLQSGERSILYLREYDADDEHYGGMRKWWAKEAKDTLSSRGWACQESILSPRILHFHSSQLFWQCRHLHLAEDNLPRGSWSEYRPVLVDQIWRNIFFDTDSQVKLEPKHIQRFSSTPRHQLARAWYCELIEREYSARQLTYGSDKLVAISGPAKAAHRNYPQRYLAGLWGDYLVEGLLWERHGKGRKAFDYRAPTWSWASQDSRIRYNCLYPENIQAICEIVNVTMETDSDNPFGQVHGGSVVLRTHVVPSDAIEFTSCRLYFPKTAFLKILGMKARVEFDTQDYPKENFRLGPSKYGSRSQSTSENETHSAGSASRWPELETLMLESIYDTRLNALLISCEVVPPDVVNGDLSLLLVKQSLGAGTFERIGLAKIC